MPRSGSTWLGKIFDSHPETFYLHEPDSEVSFSGPPILISNDQISIYINSATEYVHKLTEINSVNVIGKQPIFKKDYFSCYEYFLSKQNVLLSKIFNKFNIPINNGSKSFSEQKNCRLVWKSIESLGRLNLFSASFKECHCIHLVRHPCGYISSLLRGEKNNMFGDSISAADDYNMFELILNSNTAEMFDISLDKLKSLDPIERLAWKWLITNEHALLSNSCNSNYINLKYEDVCENPISEIKNIFNKVSLTWNTQTNNFIDKSTHSSNQNYYSLYKEPKIAATSWKKYLESDQIRKIEKIAFQGKCADLY